LQMGVTRYFIFINSALLVSSKSILSLHITVDYHISLYVMLEMLLAYWKFSLYFSWPRCDFESNYLH
jgi:hypothetical protein